MREKNGQTAINIIILAVIVLAYVLTGTGFAQSVNRDAGVPVYWSREAAGVALEVAVCGECDPKEIIDAAGKYPVAVFLCSDTMRRDPAAKYKLEQAGLYMGVYDCGQHDAGDVQGGYVLMGDRSYYNGENKIKWSVDADICTEEQLRQALFSGCIVKTEYKTPQSLQKVLNIILKSGYNITVLSEMI